MSKLADSTDAAPQARAEKLWLVNPAIWLVFLCVGAGLGLLADRWMMRQKMQKLHEQDTNYFLSQLTAQAAETQQYQKAISSIDSQVIGLQFEGVRFRSDPVSAFMFDQRLKNEHVERVAKMQSIRELALGSGQFTSDCLVHIAELPNLRNLRVYGTWIDSQAATKIGVNEKLHELILGETALSDSELKVFLECFPNLTHLSLEHGVKNAGPATMQAVSQLKHLQKLAIDNPTLKDDDLAAVAGSKSIKILQLGGCSFSNAALPHVGKIESLVELDLGGNPISEEGLLHLTGLKNLKKLGVVSTLVESTQDITSKLPNCVVELKSPTGMASISPDVTSPAFSQ